MREAGDQLANLIHLSRADVTSYRQERVLAATMRADEFERRCQELLQREDVARLHSPLDGDDLMALFGRPPGLDPAPQGLPAGGGPGGPARPGGPGDGDGAGARYAAEQGLA